jgi:hypothetical protein
MTDPHASLRDGVVQGLITIPSVGEPSVELIRLRSEECRG